MARSKKPTPLADMEKPFMQKMKHMAYSFVACSVIIMALLLFLSPNAAAGVLLILFLLTGISFPAYVLAINNNPIKQHALSFLHIYSGIGVVFSCTLGFLASVVMYNANIKEKKEKIAAEQIEKQNKKEKLAWQGDNLAFRCSRKDLTVTTSDGSEKLLEIFIQHDASNKRAKVYMTGSVLESEILDIEESDEQFDYSGSGLYVIDTIKTEQRTDSVAQRTFSYTVSGKRINELKLNRFDGKLKFKDSIDYEYAYLRTIDCQKIESVAFASQTRALKNEAFESDMRAISKKEAEHAELKAKRKF